MDMFCLQPTAALDRLGSGGGSGSCLGERTDGIEQENGQRVCWEEINNVVTRLWSADV